MAVAGQVRLAELFGALGLFADLADGFPAEKVMRTAALAADLARRSGAGEEDVRDAYFTTLLRYAGCVGFSHEEAHEFGGGDDRQVRNVMSMADVTNPLGTVSAIMANLGRGMPLLARAQGVGRILSDKTAVLRHARAQCETSLWLARLVGAGEPLLCALEQICERYDGRGFPAGSSGDELRFAMRVSHVADIAEIAFHRGGVGAAVAEVRRRAGGQLDPSLAGVLCADAVELFARIDGPSVWDVYLAAEPEPHALADGEKVDVVARAFGALADLKSVYTVGHSARVARLTRAAAESLGLSATELERAGHLHDMGRVAVPNAVWDRPGPLGTADLERVRMHAYYTERIVRRAGCLAGVAALAGAAHERVDGEGYPKGTAVPALELGARVLGAADVLAALLEERPHRAAFTEAAAKDEVARMATTGALDRTAVDAVLAAAGLASAPRVAAGHDALTEREIDVIRWLARGKSNREIGELLGISPRTVQNHVAHVYDKLGLYSRAGATLWAVERGLLR